MPSPVDGAGYRNDPGAVIDNAGNKKTSPTGESTSSACITQDFRVLTYEDLAAAGRELARAIKEHPFTGVVVNWKKQLHNKASEEKDPQKVEKDPAPNKATEEKDPQKVEKDPAPNKATEEKDPQKVEKDPSPENSVEKDPAPKKDSYTPEIEKGEKDPNATDEEPGRFS